MVPVAGVELVVEELEAALAREFLFAGQRHADVGPARRRPALRARRRARWNARNDCSSTSNEA